VCGASAPGFESEGAGAGKGIQNAQPLEGLQFAGEHGEEGFFDACERGPDIAGGGGEEFGAATFSADDGGHGAVIGGSGFGIDREGSLSFGLG